MEHGKKSNTSKVFLVILIALVVCAGIVVGYDIVKTKNSDYTPDRVGSVNAIFSNQTTNTETNNTTNNTLTNNTTENVITDTNSQPEQSQPEQSQPEQSQPEQSQPEQSQPEQSQPTSSNNGDLFGNYYEKAQTLLDTMTVEEKVGQMFLARYPSSGVNEEIKNYNPGGYVLFGRDFKYENKSSISAKLQENQSNSKIKLALGVDEEGGTVVRVSAYTAFRSSKFKSPQQLWKIGYLQKILDDSKEKSALLKSVGLNMNLAPVSDVPTKSSSFIYARSYGRGAEKTATYVGALIKTMNADGMISTMKHFPGYGDNVDTHTGIAIDERPMSTFESSDFLPFKSGIEAGGPTILVNHNIVKAMDETKPASLSENVHKILREELHFTGIIMTDDLAMDAVKQYVENGEAAVQAVLAGNDMIISSNFQAQRNEVLAAVNNGKISIDTINTAVRRILAWKYAYNII